MLKKLPILIIIPHGGYKIPEELSNFVDVTEFDLFMQADTCANEIFDFSKMTSAKLDTNISRLFIDLDRPITAIPPAKSDGIIKDKTLYEKKIFIGNNFPDEIAIANIIKRYQQPYIDAINKILSTDEIKLIIECHTIMPVGPKTCKDAGKPRPLVLLENKTKFRDETITTCSDMLAKDLLFNLGIALGKEEGTITDKVLLKDNEASGYLLEKFGTRTIPMVRLSVSKALFINDDHFNYDYLSVDKIRLKEIRKKIWSGIFKFYKKNF